MNAAALLVLILAQEGDPLRRLVEALGSDEFAVRDAASRELLNLPASRSPELAEAARTARDAEVAARLRAAVLPDPWPSISPGTIGEARRARRRILGDVAGDSERAIDEFVAALPPTAAGRLEPLLDAPEPAFRKLGLASLARFPPAKAEPLLRFLDDEAVSSRAAAVIIASGDRSVLPACVERFAAAGRSARAAGAVLRRLVPDDLGSVADVYRNSVPLRSLALEILRAAGPRAEDALAGLLATAGPDGRNVLILLIEVCSERSFPAIRGYLARNFDAEADRILARLRDPVWAAAALARHRAAPGEFLDQELARIAPAGGVRLRPELLEWLAQPGLKVSVRQALLPALGVSGRREEGALAVAALEDPRLREAAAEAIDRLGDPAHSPALVRAWMKGDPGNALGGAVAGVDPTAVEAELLEILADPRGYPSQSRLAAVLAGRAPTPRIREAFLRGLAEGGNDFALLRGEALRALSGRTGPEDLPWIAKLQASELRETHLRVAGHLLALRGGDVASALPLARLIPERNFFIPLDPSFDGHGALPVLRLAAPAGKAWADAVVQVLGEKPSWTEGAMWLAESGRREGVDSLRAREAALAGRETEGALRALAAAGEADALDRLFDRAVERNQLSEWEISVLVAKAGPALRARAFRRAQERSGVPRDPGVLLAVRWGGPEAAGICRGLLDRDPNTFAGWASGDPLLLDCFASVAALGDPSFLPRLRPYLRVPEAAHRAAAALALARMGDRGSIALLVRLVDDPEPVHREPATTGPRRRVWHAAMEALGILDGVRPEAGTTVERRAFWRDRHEKPGDRGGR